MKYSVYGIKTPLITKENGLEFENILFEAINKDYKLENGDILVISGKVIAIAKNEIIDLRKVVPSPRALKISEQSNLDPRFVQVVDEHSDVIFGWASGALMTIKDRLLLANSGIDRSNAIEDYYAIPLPSKPQKYADDIKRFMEEKTKKKLGVIISDSSTRPMRKGTTGLAIAVSGMPEIIDDVGKSDLYGYEMQITSRAIADNIVCSAQLLMGESNEQTPVCIIRGLNYVGMESKGSMIIPKDQCIFMRNFHFKSL